jgi:hypothetical protein
MAVVLDYDGIRPVVTKLHSFEKVGAVDGRTDCLFEPTMDGLSVDI